MIKVGKEKVITFNIDEALRFEGFTAAYIQYANARICSILRKMGALKKIQISKVNFKNLKEKSEHKLIISLAKFSESIEKSGASHNPAILAEYLYNLSKDFNDFYRDNPVLKASSGKKMARICLLLAAKTVLQNGLSLLGIEAPERM
jgi:arginyl-tRNA synthetase